MTLQEFKTLICQCNPENFKDWYNEFVVDNSGENWYQIIRENDESAIYGWAMENLVLEVFIRLCRGAKYSCYDEYVILREDSLISFGTVWELVEKHHENLEYMYERFLDNEEESLAILR